MTTAVRPESDSGVPIRRTSAVPTSHPPTRRRLDHVACSAGW
jgi:hypothetical protein